MQCASTHVFSKGDKISIEIEEVPYEYQEASRTSNGKPFPVSDTNYLPDGRVYARTYIVKSAEFCEPNDIPSRSATMRVCNSSMNNSCIPFRYQRLMIKPMGVTFADRRVASSKDGEVFTHITWFLDTTTMAVRRDNDGMATHTISKIYLYDNSKRPVIKKNTNPKEKYNIISHCPCKSCNNWFNSPKK